jgi:hypothetical protein
VRDVAASSTSSGVFVRVVDCGRPRTRLSTKIRGGSGHTTPDPPCEGDEAAIVTSRDGEVVLDAATDSIGCGAEVLLDAVVASALEQEGRCA